MFVSLKIQTFLGRVKIFKSFSFKDFQNSLFLTFKSSQDDKIILWKFQIAVLVDFVFFLSFLYDVKTFSSHQMTHASWDIQVHMRSA